VLRLPYTDNGVLPAFNIFKDLNHAPKIAGAYSRLGGMILARRDVDPKLRELVIHAISLKVEANAVTDADVQSLRSIDFDDKQIVELTMTAGFYGMTARFLNAVDVEIDEGNPANFDIPQTEGTSKAREVIAEGSEHR